MKPLNKSFHLQFYSPCACVHSATKVIARICRTGVSKWPGRIRIFSKESERKAVSDPSNSLPPAAPRVLLERLLSVMGQLGITATS